MKNSYIKTILGLFLIISSFNILSLYTDIKIYNLFPTLNADVNYDYNKQESLELLHPFTDTIIVINYGTQIRLNKKKFKSYIFQKYNPSEKAIYLLNKKDDVEKYYINDLNHISFRLNSIERNEVGMAIGGIIGAGAAFYPSAFIGFLITVGISDILGDNVYGNDTNNPIYPITCLGVTAAGMTYGAKMGMDIGGNIGNPYVNIKMSGANGWVVAPK